MGIWSLSYSGLTKYCHSLKEQAKSADLLAFSGAFLAYTYRTIGV